MYDAFYVNGLMIKLYFHAKGQISKNRFWYTLCKTITSGKMDIQQYHCCKSIISFHGIYKIENDIDVSLLVRYFQQIARAIYNVVFGRRSALLSRKNQVLSIYSKTVGYVCDVIIDMLWHAHTVYTAHTMITIWQTSSIVRSVLKQNKTKIKVVDPSNPRMR